MAQPITRDLTEVVKALEIVEQEFGFQAERLTRAVQASTENEREHQADLAVGYQTGARYAGILRRYHEGRLRRRESPYRQDSSIDASGRAVAHVGDEQADGASTSTDLLNEVG
jgi:hypothetical protein